MDGRDIGTVILPNADVKIFLTASNEVRAQRRYEELRAKGSTLTYEQILADMNARDAQDSQREIAPAIAAPDAIVVDNSGNTFDQSVDQMMTVIREELVKKGKAI